jgi:hypothetical protein
MEDRTLEATTKRELADGALRSSSAPITATCACSSTLARGWSVCEVMVPPRTGAIERYDSVKAGGADARAEIDAPAA